jgi:hypothetical protein
MKRKMWLIIFIGLVSILSSLITKIPNIDYLEFKMINNSFALDDSSGPIIELPVYLPLHIDCAITAPVSYLENFTITVSDDDGVDTIIGSYKYKIHTTWTNITMTKQEITNTTVKSTLSLNFTVNWDIFNSYEDGDYIDVDLRFIANDTVGNWGVKQTYVHLGMKVVLSDNTESNSNHNFMLLIIFGCIVILCLVVIFSKYRGFK